MEELYTNGRLNATYIAQLFYVITPT